MKTKMVKASLLLALFTLLGIISIYGARISTQLESVSEISDINKKDDAVSPLYERMFYEWTGQWGISGLLSYSWSGYARFSHAGGNSFDVDYYDSYMGSAAYTVDNTTRLITAGSSYWNNMHDTLWILNNVTINDSVLIRNQWAMADQVFSVVGEDNRTAMGKIFECWYLTGPSGGWAYYEKESGLLIDGNFRYYESLVGYTFFYRYTLSKTNAPNNNPPQLLDAKVTPPSGNTTTLFHFTVNYTDADDNEPEYVNVTIDGVTNQMLKENSSDIIYTDGVIYIYSMPMTNTTHSFYFNASDWRFNANTNVVNGPHPVLKVTDNPPQLSLNNLYPQIGHLGVNYRFRVTYSDPDNDIPVFVNVTINGTVVSMSRLDLEDNNYLDGVIYEGFRICPVAGNYTYFFNASDGLNIVGYPNITFAGPEVWAPYPIFSPLFDGTYIDYGGNYGGSGWTGRENYTYISGNEFGCYSTNSRTGSDYRQIDNRTRFFTAQTGLWGNNSYDWTWIFTNISLTDIVPIAIYQEGYRNFTVTGETTKSRMGETFDCWELSDGQGSAAYYDKILGIFIEGTFQTGGGTIYQKWITDTNIPDIYPPTLSNGTVMPSVGDLSTSFVFQVNYTDPDNNHPTYINLILNNETHALTKLDGGDSNYTDGCIYTYTTLLQNITYSYYFEASDNHFDARNPGSGNYSGPVVNQLNVNPPMLANESLIPKYVTQWHTYDFIVRYYDSDNLAPVYVNVTFNKDGVPYGTYEMTPDNASDTYYVDGNNYSISLQFPVGNYTYYFETSDSDFVTRYPSAGYFNDLLITNAKTSIFDGFWFTYHVAQNMPYGGTADGTVVFAQNGPTTYDRDETRVSHTIVGDITNYYWDEVNSTDRLILQSDNFKTDERVQDVVWNNTRLGSTVYLRGENMLYDLAVCIGSEVISVMGDSYDCWKFVSEITTLWYEKQTGMFLYSYSNVGGGYSITKTITATNMDFTVNDYVPVLSNGSVNPGVGWTNTTFTFQVNYSDADNNPPQYVQLNLNETAFNMTQLNPGDTNYIDGALFVHSTMLPLGNHTYNFTAYDGGFIANHPSVGHLIGPNVSIAPNSNPPTLSSGQVTPPVGDLTTQFDFLVSYADIENMPPLYVNVTVDGQPYQMSKLDSGDNNYVDGVIFNCTLTLPIGNYTFHFNASDENFEAHYPIAGVLNGPNVTNNPPILINPSLNPSIGDTKTLFNFTINYTDADNHMPTSIDLNINGVGSFPMDKQNSSDNNYIDGCIFIFSTYLDVGNFTYYFSASDGYDTARYPSMGSLTGPSVNPPPNEPPILTNGGVIPSNGFSNTVFVFRVTYMDIENSAPSGINVVIDGFTYAMMKAEPTDINYTDGVEYLFAITLSSGPHTYYFTTSDGINTSRYPSAGTITGPTFGAPDGGPPGMDLMLAIIIAVALAVAIPIVTYITGRKRRPAGLRKHKTRPLEFKPIKKLPPTRHEKAEPKEVNQPPIVKPEPVKPLTPPSQPPIAKVEPIKQVTPPIQPPVAKVGSTKPVPPPTQPPAVQTPLTEAQLKEILDTVPYLPASEKEKLVEKLKIMSYEQQQAVLRAFKR